jgi:hypothetical protein
LNACAAAPVNPENAACRLGARPDLVYRPVTDAVPVETCVVVAGDRRERRVLDFAAVAAETLGDEPARLAAAD